jgi:transcriptional regulator with GAF, ATPase, and Fis domain
MFEEIVGNSSALQTVLSRVVKVVPTDSTVLVTGEPGRARNLLPAPFTDVPSGPPERL